MAGLHDTDIRLNEYWQLTPAANGDAPLVSELECLLQDIRLESLTHEGELFYDREYGWSLLDFLHRDGEDEMTVLEIRERVRSKLSRRVEIDPDSITVTVSFGDDITEIQADFSVYGQGRQVLQLGLDRVKIEVVEL